MIRPPRFTAVALLALIACGKSPYQQTPPPAAKILVYSQTGTVMWSWSHQKQALVEGPAPATAPAYDYTTNIWTQGGERSDGPSISLDEQSVKNAMRTAGLQAGQKVVGVTCTGTKRDLCYGAVCESEGDALKHYFLRVCDLKNQTTAACKAYKVEDRKLTQCPVWFYVN